ncbi:MAG: PD-(D/E)XK nuclease domain-containing protein, partial [bacterium]
VSSFRVNTEDRTNLGRIDLVLESDSRVYLFEFKVNSSAQAALEQIKEKKYYEKYLNIQVATTNDKAETRKAHLKEVLVIGVNFSLEERNVTDWVVESIGL